MNYWDRKLISRRQALRALGATGGGLAALSLIGCGSSSNSGGTKVDSEGVPQGYQIPGTGLSKLDPRAGKPGGTFVQQSGTDPTSLRLIIGRGEVAGRHTHSGLVQFSMGYPGGSKNGIIGGGEPDLALAMPETPDPTTYIFKLRRDVKFHNGAPLTAQDVVYTFQRNLTHAQSLNKSYYTPWYENAVAVDDYTVKLTTKIPYVNTLDVLAWYFLVVNRDWEESPRADSALMGTGPFKFKNSAPPSITRLERNPEYFDKPYPYVNELHILGAADDAKKLADWSSKQVHATYWASEELRDQMKKARPDGVCFCYFYPTPSMFMRTDKPPFNDKRVRQAMMLAVDRDKLRQVATKGEGEDDQYFSWVLDPSFKKPKDLGASAKFWKQDLTAAKQLLSAAGANLPFQQDMWHYDNSFVGQPYVDSAIFIQNSLKQQGIANFTDHETNGPQGSQTWISGNYDGMAYWLGDSGGFIYPYPFFQLQLNFAWPADYPSANRSHIDSPVIRDTISKAVQEFDTQKRLALIGDLQTIMADEQYVMTFGTRSDNFFLDPRVKNAVIPLLGLGSSLPWIRKWWFDPVPS